MKFPRTPQEPRRPRPRRAVEALHGVQDVEDMSDSEFDPNRDFSRELVQQQVLNAVPPRGSWQLFGLQALPAVLLYPDMRDELPLDEKAKEGIKKSMDDTVLTFRDISNDCTIADLALCLRVLFQYEDDSDSRESQQLRERLTSSLSKFRKNKQWLGWCTLAKALSVLYPDAVDSFGIDHEAWEGVKEFCIDNRADVSTYIRMISSVAFLFPDRKQELKITTQEWEAAKAQLEKYRRTPSNYGSFAKDMYIASSERFVITPEGEAIVTPKTPNMQPPAPMPQRPHL